MKFRAHTGRQWLRMAMVVALAWSFAAEADIFVPNDYPTVQGAINAAQDGDIIHLAAGLYGETLTINKSVSIVGSGAGNCVIFALTNVPVINIAGPAVVNISGLEVEGGQYMGPGWFSGFSGYGITATNATVVLNGVVLNQFINYFVTIHGGSLAATNVALWTRNVLGGCDVGFELDGCSAVVNGLTQDAGHLDHTINVNGALGTNHADVTVANCRIRTSSLDYGNCVRTYVNSTVRVTNCFLYRGTGEAVPAFPAFSHAGVSVNGYSNVVSITGNVISNVPWSIYCYGSLGGNQVTVESNVLMNSTIGGVIWDAMPYPGIDLGGGPLGSRGGNVFSETPAPGTNFFGDILVTNSSGVSSANIFALHNSWSNPNKESVIYDHLDKPALGRVISDDLTLAAAGHDASGHAVLTWNERGAGEQYTIERCGDLNGGPWTNAAGSWPVTNGSLNPMLWTNPVAGGTNVFFRVRSVVP